MTVAVEEGKRLVTNGLCHGVGGYDCPVEGERCEGDAGD